MHTDRTVSLLDSQLSPKRGTGLIQTGSGAAARTVFFIHLSGDPFQLWRKNDGEVEPDPTFEKNRA